MEIEVLKESGLIEDARIIRQHMVAFNDQQSGGTDYRELQVILRDENGKVRGGLLGWTVWSWFHIDSLWVDEPIRGQNWGTSLIRAGEQEARTRDCEISDVDTFSFQAKAFYEKAGYLCYGTLSGIQKGEIERYYFRKSLREDGAASQTQIE